MNISPLEANSIKLALAIGKQVGYGNLISHLRTRWARDLMEEYGLGWDAAILGAHGQGSYPPAMQDDLLERYEWDETGARYA